MNFKIYQHTKIKSDLKNNTLLFFVNGVNQDCVNWVKVEQGLKKLKFIYYKVFNKLTIKILKTSIFFNLSKTIAGPFFFFIFKRKKFEIDKILLFSKHLKSLFFSLFALKLNNKVYSIIQIKKLSSFKYSSNIVLFYQFLFIHLKKLSILK